MDFDRIYQEHYKRVFNYCYKITGEREGADDAVQEAFMKLYELSIKGYRPDNALHWLLKVAGNLCLNTIKKNHRSKDYLKNVRRQDNDSLNPEAKLLHNEKKEQLRQAVDKLPPKHRLLVLLYGDGRSYKELSAITGIPEASVGKTLWRTIDKLSKTIHRYEKK